MNEKINVSVFIIFFGFFFSIWRIFNYLANWEHYYIFLNKVETHNYLMDYSPKRTLLHILSGSIVLLINVLQYYRKKDYTHRVLGYISGLFVLISFPLAIYLSLINKNFSIIDCIIQIGTAIGWIYSYVASIIYVRQGDIVNHRKFAVRYIAITNAVTFSRLGVYILKFISFNHLSFNTCYTVSLILTVIFYNLSKIIQLLTL